MNTLEQAKAFLGRLQELGKEWRAKLKELPEDVQEVFWKLRKSSFYVEETRNPKCRREHPSPDGQYKLVVDSYSPKDGGWNLTQGLVYHLSSDKPVAVVQRNYSSFPHLWVEHPNGHLYLVCGEDYQGQTVLEVDTGARKDYLPEDAKQGFGFCWVQYEFDKTSQTLVVEGCIWACPFEFRFYDFSNPMEGWPQLEADRGVYSDRHWPEIGSEGLIRCYQSDDDDDAEEGAPQLPPASILTFKREGLKLTLQEEWVSEKEQASREAQRKANEEFDAWLKNFKATDPLYLELNRLVVDFDHDKQYGLSIGFTYADWCPHWKGDERRVCRNVVQNKDGRKLSVTIEWGVETGPIKLNISKDDQPRESVFFEHSLEGMRAAFAQIPPEARL